MVPKILRQRKAALEGNRAVPKNTAQGGRALNSPKSPPNRFRLGKSLFAKPKSSSQQSRGSISLTFRTTRSMAECPGVARGSIEEPIHNTI